jgi:hypothetical protein
MREKGATLQEKALRCAAEWKKKILRFKEREKNERSTSPVDA